jgi:Replication-relaxation
MSRATQAPSALPPIATEVMESLYQHRLLSSTQVHQLHTPNGSMTWTRHILSTLADAGLAGHAPARGRLKLWYLTERGSEAIETIPTRGETRRRQISPEQAAGPLRAHTLAVNDVGISFVKAARDRGDDCGALSWRHEIAHPVGPALGRRPGETLIADALLTYTQQRSDRTLVLHQRVIELDRATIPVQALAEKFARYTRLRRYAPQPQGGGNHQPAWREYYPEFPAVLVTFAHRERATLERRVQSTIALYGADARCRELAVLLVLLDDLMAHGPFASVFIDPRHPERYVDWLGRTPALER